MGSHRLSPLATLAWLALLPLVGASACKSPDAQASPGAAPPVGVIVQPAEPREFRDAVLALGTARARESAELTAKLTETVRHVHFNDGDTVRRGQLLVELTRQEEHAQLREARAELENAESEVQRYDALSRDQLVSGLERDRVRHAARLAKARLSTTQARLADRVIVAPFDGVLGLRNVSVGSIVRPDTVVATIDDVSLIKLDFPVPETELDGLKPGLSVLATTRAYPDRPFTGKVTGIDTRVDPVTRSVVVRAEIPNPGGELRPGMLLTVEVVRARRQAVSVPAAALVPLGEQQHVFVLQPDDTVQRVPIDIGHRGDRFVEVTKGLEANTPVVVDGTIKLRPGARVAPQRRDPS
jgi:membrane fusion protein (multidrug efflux system)